MSSTQINSKITVVYKWTANPGKLLPRMPSKAAVSCSGAVASRTSRSGSLFDAGTRSWIPFRCLWRT